MRSEFMAAASPQKLAAHCGVPQEASENLRQSGTDGRMMRFTGNLSLSITGRMLGFRASPISTRGSKCGLNLWKQHHHKSSRRITKCCKRRARIYVNLGQMAE